LISVCAWAVLIGTVAVYSDELHWSLQNLGGALRGRFASPPEKSLLDAAIKQMDSGGESAKSLLLQAEAIDPNLPSKYYLAVLELEDGNVEEAEQLLLELLRIDETHLKSYLLLIEIYRGSERNQLAQENAERGIRVFQERASLHTPMPSQTKVAESRKSAKVHEQYESAVKVLQDQLKALRV
jgi:tetratricopeptide (TPR) repeat protein